MLIVPGHQQNAQNIPKSVVVVVVARTTITGQLSLLTTKQWSSAYLRAHRSLAGAAVALCKRQHAIPRAVGEAPLVLQQVWWQGLTGRDGIDGTGWDTGRKDGSLSATHSTRSNSAGPEGLIETGGLLVSFAVDG